MKIKNQLLVVALLSAAMILALPTKAQVTIGVLRKPNATLEVAKLPDGSATPDGLMPPQMTLKQINDAKGKYTTYQAGAMVFCTATDTATIPGYSDKITCTGQVYWNGAYWVSDCGELTHYVLAVSQPQAFSFYETGNPAIDPVVPLVFTAEGSSDITYQWYKIVGSNINFRVAAPCTATDGAGFATNSFTPSAPEKGSTRNAANCGFYRYFCVAKNNAGDSIESNRAEVAVGCGAKDMSGDWISFMCFNLGANPQTIAQQKTTSITLTPNVAVASTFFRSANEKNLYGDLYQWGRIGDGHQNRNAIQQGSTGANTTTDNVVSYRTATPPTYEVGTNGYPWNQVARTNSTYYGKFIITSAGPEYDWFSGVQSTSDLLWRDSSFPNNDPCSKINADGTTYITYYPTASGPFTSGTGWCLPSQTEWGLIFRGGNIGGAPSTAYANNWNWYQLSAAATEGAKGMEIKPDGVTTTLFLPANGYRYNDNALLYNSGGGGYYWSGTVSGVNAFYLFFGNGIVTPANVFNRGTGYALRCVKQ